MLKVIARDIKDLRIQGASNIARAGLRALDYVAKNSKAKNKKAFTKELYEAINKLIASRETEPMLKNVLKYVFYKLKEISGDNYKQEIKRIIRGLRGRTQEAKESVFEIGSNIVKRGDVVLTHCHSSNVMGILKKAKPKHVFCTETRPRFQGRLTAKELVSDGINTTMIVDSAVVDYIKEVDKVLLGCDMITPNSVVNKVGSRLIGLLCEKYDIPLYICSTSFKFDPASVIGKGVGIEERSPSEVWRNPPRKLKILNPAFDSIDYDNITSFINELGLFSPDSLFISLRERYKWMFEKV